MKKTETISNDNESLSRKALNTLSNSFELLVLLAVMLWIIFFN
ncbi:hypothetical protein [Roseivirga pacifica]|nr:hypothetical protein [Roseivirga pacifica]